jgi:Ca2+-binding EF-hand superfamily protein
VSFLATLVCAVLAALQSPEERFERLDEDGDGTLSRAELSMLARDRFEELDRDDDGVVDVDEFRALETGRDPGVTLRRLDADADGRIAVDEVPESMRARFESADTDGDGFVDPDEIRTMVLRAREARNGPSALMRRLMELDLDGDGRLHRDELPEAMEFLRGQFDRFDVNGDDYLDGAELRAMTEERRRLRFRRH